MSSRGYFATRISEHIGRTPEGYLICREVPISRVGWQEYIGREVDPEDDGMLDSKVRVYRSEREVFDPASMASFEGKTVVDLHPSEWVTTATEPQYHRGHAQNIRRGTGEFRDCLLADLFIKCEVLINKILNGLREVSCGYYCTYAPIGDSGDMFEQRQIRGNHVAIVPNGRAGSRVAIRDSAPPIPTNNRKEQKEKKVMNVTIRKLLGLGLKEYAKDAEPEAVAEAFELAKNAQETPESKQPGVDAMPAPPPAPPAPAVGMKDDQVMEALGKILGVLEQLVQSDKQVHAQVAPQPAPAPEEQLDALANAFGGEETPAEEELENGEEEGEVGFLDADSAPPLPESDLPKNPIPGADARSVVRDTILAMKPFVAMLPEDQKQKAVDALTASLGRVKPPTSKQPEIDYGMLSPAFMKRVEDAQKKKDARAQDDGSMGKDYKEKFHRK